MVVLIPLRRHDLLRRLQRIDERHAGPGVGQRGEELRPLVACFQRLLRRCRRPRAEQVERRLDVGEVTDVVVRADFTPSLASAARAPPSSSSLSASTPSSSPPPPQATNSTDAIARPKIASRRLESPESPERIISPAQLTRALAPGHPDPTTGVRAAAYTTSGSPKRMPGGRQPALTHH